MRSFREFFLEKVILGLEETIYIDGIGYFRAKLDTGNGAFNVLHGTNVKIDGNMVRFTVDERKNLVIERPISDTITINVGAGHTEDRPVILLNVKIGDRAFREIPFSISDRSSNTNKVLISKNFIQNDLDALIDVSLSNVAKKNLNVEV